MSPANIRPHELARNPLPPTLCVAHAENQKRENCGKIYLMETREQVNCETDCWGQIETMDDVRAALGWTWRERIADIAGLCHGIMPLTRRTDGTREIAISCCHPALLGRFRHYQHVRSVLYYACKVGLLERTEHGGEVYLFSHRVERLVFDVCEQEGITPTGWRRENLCISECRFIPRQDFCDDEMPTPTPLPFMAD